MNVIPYRISLLEPLLATRIDGDPNSAISHPYLPGSMVRGAAVRAYLRSTDQAVLDASSKEVQRLFFDGRTRYLNAYPATVTGQRMLPTPHSWFTVKGEDQPVYDFAQNVRVEVDGQIEQFSAVANEARAFCWVNGEHVYFYSPQRRVSVHTQRDRPKGRAREGAGAVFQYDALEIGEQFTGMVLVDEKSDVDLVKPLLSHVSTLGGSSNSGYGRVRIDVGESIDLTEDSWRETPGPIASVAAGQPFVVTVLSDTLVRNQKTGQYTLELKSVLQETLGVELGILSSPEDTESEEEQRGARHIREVGGFNRTWGLSLPQSQAVCAGSVFVFVASQSIAQSAIARAEWQGPVSYTHLKWLEYHVLHLLQTMQQEDPECKLHDCGMGIKPKIEPDHPEFDVDIGAMQGYRLYAISCTTDAQPSMCKLKLFEAYERARNMGGDEAHVGLVCFNDNPASLQQQLGRSWDAVDKIRVFGRPDIAHLADRLADWSKSAGRQRSK